MNLTLLKELIDAYQQADIRTLVKAKNIRRVNEEDVKDKASPFFLYKVRCYSGNWSVEEIEILDVTSTGYPNSYQVWHTGKNGLITTSPILDFFPTKEMAQSICDDETAFLKRGTARDALIKCLEEVLSSDKET